MNFNVFSRFTYTWVMVLITALLEFHIDFLRIGDKFLFNDLFGADVLDRKCKNNLKPNKIKNLYFV